MWNDTAYFLVCDSGAEKWIEEFDTYQEVRQAYRNNIPFSETILKGQELYYMDYPKD